MDKHTPKYNHTPRRRPWPYLLMATLLLLPPVFFGFDLCDSGFYATFYDGIFSRPDSVSYNFMYYLSGIAGGAVSSLTGGSLVWLRFAGLLTCLICAGCVTGIYNGDKRLFPLAAGIATVCIGVWQTPMSLYNDNMTAAISCVSLSLLIASLRDETPRRSYFLCYLAALTAGLNTFTRLPNILEFGFVLLIPIALRRGSRLYRLAELWCAGWITGFGTGLLIAALAGHLHILESAVRSLLVTASASSEDTTHSLGSLIMVQITCWWEIVKTMILLAGIGGIGRYIFMHSSGKLLKVVAVFLSAPPCLYILITGNIVTVLAAISLFGVLGILAKGRNGSCFLPAVAGLLMMIILPLGSDNGIYNAGTIVLWIAAPSGFYFIRRHFGIVTGWLAALAICCAGIVTTLQGSFYFDDTPLSAMRGKININKASGILTSAERATRIERIISSLSTKLESGDTLLVYGSAPMINHITETVPAIGCSWPELLTPGQLEKLLNESKPPRHVMIMRFNTLGSHWGESSDAHATGNDTRQNRFHNERKSRVILDYLASHGYEEELKEQDFVLYRHAE